MKFINLFLLPVLASSISACIFDSKEDKNDEIKKIEKTQELAVLATKKAYIPVDGDSISSQVTLDITFEDEVLVNKQYNRTSTYSYVNALPLQYGYQHSDPGPFLKEQDFNIQAGSPIEETKVSYYSLLPTSGLLIEHDLNDHYYSITEYNQRDDTSTDNNDGLLIKGEVATSTHNNKFFDEVTGNEVGSEFYSSTLTALNSEEISILAGTFNSAKVSFIQEHEVDIYDSPSESWKQTMTGFYWLDSNTGSTLKLSLTGTYINTNNPNRVLITSMNSELISSSEYVNNENMRNSNSNRHVINNIKKYQATILKAIKSNRLVNEEFDQPMKHNFNF